ncbi:MAG TPA: sigma-70 family RNA polymerase sigma factor [Acidimicrobiales bacterium]|nr:sigma-70 family RNA polymerase sigma factor [Acidimicrobiales bacterium]
MARSHRSAEQILLARFEEFFRAHFARLSLYVARRVPSTGVDDVVATSFVVAWKKFETVGSPSLPWLFRIASYEVANHRRTMRRFDGDVSLELVGDAPTLGGTDEFDGYEVVAALQRLSELDREILQLIHWEGLSRNDTAEVLGITTNAVNVRHHRALQHLSNQMAPVTIFETTDAQNHDRSNSATIKKVLP